MTREQVWKESRILVFCLLAATGGAFIGSHISAANTPVAAATVATPATPGSIETSFAPVVDRALPAVVNISSSKVSKSSQSMQSQMDPFFRQFFGRDFAPNQEQRNMPERREHSLGSGVIVRADGYLLTNNHVIDGATDITVTLNDKRELKAKLVGTDPKTDIAVLKVDAVNLPTLPFASSKARVGDIVLAMGNPFGLSQTVTMGIVSAQGRSNLGIEDYEDFIQTDAPINPGNSGGALLNTRGELIGINTAILANNGGNQGVGFAVPVALAHSVMTQVMEHGKVVRGYLGVVPQDITPALSQALHLEQNKGVVIGDVTPDGPAGKAGMERGDVVLNVDGAKVDDANQLRMKISMTAPGTTVNLKTLRNGSEKTVAVKLGELPGSSNATGNSGNSKGSSSALDGVSVDTLNAQTLRQMQLPPTTHGVAVTNVEQGSAAQAAGLREGDVIQEVNRMAVSSAADFDRAVRNAGSGTVLLLVNRGGYTQYVAIQG